MRAESIGVAVIPAFLPSLPSLFHPLLLTAGIFPAGHMQISIKNFAAMLFLQRCLLNCARVCVCEYVCVCAAA